MEYADAGNLKQLIEKARDNDRELEEEFVLEIFTQMVVAVQFLHKKLILHRDLKCLNIRITTGNVIKLADFGHAKQVWIQH